jgi:hypothetical protein
VVLCSISKLTVFSTCDGTAMEPRSATAEQGLNLCVMHAVHCVEG